MWGGHSPGWEPPADRAAAAGLSLTGKWATISSYPQQSWHWGTGSSRPWLPVWMEPDCFLACGPASLLVGLISFSSNIADLESTEEAQDVKDASNPRRSTPMDQGLLLRRHPLISVDLPMRWIPADLHVIHLQVYPSKTADMATKKMLLKHVSTLLMMRPWLTNLQGNLAILALKMLFTIGDSLLTTFPNMSSDSVGLCDLICRKKMLFA